jgi:hypothetical protein
VPTERRRARTCPSCGGSNIVRGREVEGLSICLVPATEESPEVTLPAYSDICYECGLVSLFVRIGHAHSKR